MTNVLGRRVLRTAAVACVLGVGWVSDAQPLEPVAITAVRIVRVGTSIVCVVNVDDEVAARWFVSSADSDQCDTFIGSGLGNGHDVGDLVPSTDLKYLAVVSWGEGHPVLEVVDLTALIHERAYRVVQEVNPYPGVLSIVGWEGSELTLRSDAALSLREANGSVPVGLTLPNYETFALQIPSGALRSVTFDAAQLARSNIDLLSDLDPVKRSGAAVVLGSLRWRDARPALSRALAKETDHYARQALVRAIDAISSNSPPPAK